jgi:chondroitin AC lyase
MANFCSLLFLFILSPIGVATSPPFGTSTSSFIDSSSSSIGAAATSSSNRLRDPVLEELHSRIVNQNILSVASTVTEASTLDTVVTYFVSQIVIGQGGNATFKDIDYNSPSAACWPSINHTIRVRLFLCAFLSPQSRYYNNSNIKKYALAALSWWLKHDLTSSNWWDNDIATPLNIGAAVLLIESLGITLTPEQLGVVDTILSRASVSNSGTSTGANLLWQGTAIVMRGILFNNITLVEYALNASYEGIGYSTPFKDGPQRDGSFNQHGQQIYSGGYGSFYTQTVLGLLNLTANTTFAISDIRRLEEFSDFLLDGELRTIYYANPEAGGAAFDISVCGRGISRPFVGHFANIGLESGMQLPFTSSMLRQWGATILPRGDEIEAFADLVDFGVKITNTTSIQVGSRVLYLADSGIHARPSWMSTIRLHSNRLLGSECVNDEGKKSGHLVDGTNFLYRSGFEYANRTSQTLIFPSYDWEKIPGTTVRLGALPLDCDHVSGIFGIQSFAGGVQDGNLSHLVMALDWIAPQHQGLFVRKSWSFFNDIYVAMGSNVSVSVSNVSELKKEALAVVVTTIDQRLLNVNGGVYTSNSPTIPLQANDGKSPLNASIWWLWHDYVGYIIPTGDIRGDVDIHLSNIYQQGDYNTIGAFSGNVSIPIFSFWLQHNMSSNNSSGYAYIVVPNVELKDFATTGAKTILEDLVLSWSIESHAVLLKSEGVFSFSSFDTVSNGYLNVSTDDSGFPQGWRVAIGKGPVVGIIKEIQGKESNATSGIEFSFADPTHASPASTILISMDRDFIPSQSGIGYCGSDAPTSWSAKANAMSDGSSVLLECSLE